MRISENHQLLIIDHVDEAFIHMFNGVEVIYRPTISLPDLKEALKQATILVLRSKLSFNREWIDSSPKLQLIGRLGSGMDNIDIEYAEKKGITCLNAPEGNRNAVAEQTVGMLLGLLANIVKSNQEIANLKWDRKGNQGIELRNLTVGIIGYGNIGRRLSDLLQGFGCKVVAYDKYLSGFGQENITEVTLGELQQVADVVTLHVPLNTHSKNMINAQFISAMAKPFFLLNLSRGGVVHIPDCIAQLKKGKIRGLALDVLPNEKLDALTALESADLHFLSNHSQVILTPHIGGHTQDSYKLLPEVLANKINSWINQTHY